ncbi:MAG: helix-turn-helix transcriptional regulator [Candidatus Merdisoma sp.]|jgi:transcriptional regulator with XRE-family HTH domain
MANVGKNIRRLRNEKRMTQDELAEKLFVSRQTISNYETGVSLR